MNPISPIAQTFVEAADAWVCDSCSLVIRYIAVVENDKNNIIDALLHFGPLPTTKKIDFATRAGSIVAGQKTFPTLRQQEARRKISEAVAGRIQLGKDILELASEKTPHYYSEMSVRDRWFFELHLQIAGKPLAPVSTESMLQEDQALRASRIPFDGLLDLTQWLALNDRRGSTQGATVAIRVAPPADVLLAPTNVSNDMLHIELVTQSKLDTSLLGLAARVAPGMGIKSRMQLAQSIVWKRPSKGLRNGTIDLKVPNAQSVLLVLTLGPYTIRRQWFEDASRASNVSVQPTHLDHAP